MQPPKTDNDTVPIALRLLLVEDHELLAEVTAEFLRVAGLEVRVAATGSDALSMIVDFRPDLVLCDLNLPDMSGVEIARALRKDPAMKHTLFVIHTALNETEFDHHDLGDIDLFVSKPMDKEKLDKLLSLKAAR
jgi:CheY-like chemotaxis protein